MAESRLKISQNEARLKSMQESLREAENKKRTLEENIDTLQSQFAKMKAAGIKKLYFFNYLQLLYNSFTVEVD